MAIASKDNPRDGVVVVTYRDRGDEREFLYVQNKRSGNFTWVAGGTDGEPYNIAARRELKEETGLDAIQLEETEHLYEFNYDGNAESPGKQKLFVAKVDPAQEIVNPPDEITDVFWTSYEDAANHLTFPEQVELLKTLRQEGRV